MVISLVSGVLTPSLFYGLNLNTVVNVREMTDFTILSDYVAKFGNIRPLLTVSEVSDIDMFNSIIDNVYGYVIFDTPIVLSQKTRNGFIDIMEDINKEIRQEESTNYFEDNIFSSKLINTVNKPNLEFTDIKLIINELEDSSDKFCNGVSNFLKDNPNNQANIFGDLCKGKSERLFTKEGTKYVLKLKDVDIFDYRSSEKNYEGKLRLSDLQVEIYEKAGDIVIAINEEAIKEVENIEGKFQFNQYGFEVEHKDSETFGGIYDKDITKETVYLVVSNSEELINASEGNIEQTSTLNDVWHGFRMGRLFKSPSYVIMLSITAISWVLFILFTLSLIMIVRRK